ncbi:MAG: potassium transporter Kup [Burkholderiaceae bacterium]|nr:potassium transporter Kup [Burkholderiaceae bacterium]
MTALAAHSSSVTSPRHGLAALSLGALGVVYGDIGTSPLYAIKEVFSPAHGVPVDAPHIIGAVSVIFWALMLVVTLKYVILILRADNRGEGGIMALTALAAKTAGSNARRRHILLLLGVFGAALFYGDSVITPAVSVLGAMEGVTLIAPELDSLILPVSVTILVALFMMQRYGTAAVGKLFGPIIVLWFGTLAVAGGLQIAAAPAILQALNPINGIQFLVDRGPMMFAAFGTIVLVLTGAEALYADMGHFGKTPIRIAWTGLVLPALALNYMGQGAVLMQDPQALTNPFYHLFSEDWLIPAVILATLASVIASQAVISGAYSMTRQAMQLGFLPRLQVHYTSDTEAGQIYMPQVNRVLLVTVLLVTIGFGSSSALAAAYGIAVTGTMLITTILTYFVVRHAWTLPKWAALTATGFFLTIDAVLLISCMLKFFDGGWFPILMAVAIFTLMATWRRGRALLVDRMSRDDPALLPFIGALTSDPDLPRIPRTAVYATSSQDTVPQALLHNLKHNRVLHEQNVILTVRFDDVPRVPHDEQLELEPLTGGFWRLQVRYGFMDKPDIPAALARCEAGGLVVNAFETSYFLSRETVVPNAGNGMGMARWRDQLFSTMSRNAGNVVEFFQLPDNAVIELGTRVQI